YRGLALLALALELEGQAQYTSALQTAKLVWLTYVSEAPADGPWVSRARQHLTWLDSQLAELLPED
ncbi:MAG: hypothetical protein RJA70_3505, partial [Pseudomonadota bacterium]